MKDPQTAPLNPRTNQRTIVYVGPSLSEQEARALFPEADVRPPIQRGDLYRDRERGGSSFLILDGVFHAHWAVPAREVLDVLADGAMVAGASSMGALRAAECHPAGMRGIGSIFRLFRRGILGSDDEVALIFADFSDGDLNDSDPSGGDPSIRVVGLRPFQPLSVALIDVRYAARRAHRSGRLSASEAERLVGSAESLHYSERHWPGIWRGAELDDEVSIAWLEAESLKALDARRALRRVRSWMKANPRLGERVGAGPFQWTHSEETRELRPEPLAGLDVDAFKRDWGYWMWVSGRFRRYLPAFALNLGGEWGNPESLAASLLMRSVQDSHGVAMRAVPERAVRRGLSRRIDLRGLEAELCGQEADIDELTDFLWVEMGLRGELEPAHFRYLAFREALDAARSAELSARAIDIDLAESEIACSYDMRSWDALRSCSASVPGLLMRLETYRDELSLCKRMRDRRLNLNV